MHFLPDHEVIALCAYGNFFVEKLYFFLGTNRFCSMIIIINLFS